MVDTTCRTPVGLGDVAVKPGRSRSVRVDRIPLRFTSTARDLATVQAELYLFGRRGPARLAARRSLTLKAVPLMARPQSRTAVWDVDSMRTEDPASYRAVFEVDTPLGTTSAAVAVRGSRAELHPAGAAPYVVPAESFVPGGVAFHGELELDRGKVPPGSRQAIDSTACGMSGCRSFVDTLRIPDPDDPRPICVIAPPGKLLPR